MYKPPLNSNRVKSIKNKFESIDNEQQKNSFQSPSNKKNLKGDCPFSPKRCHNTENVPGPSNSRHQILCRQLSDPAKRNIKRSPAFRVDKNIGNEFSVKKEINSPNKLFENKIRQFNSTKSFEKTESSNEYTGTNGEVLSIESFKNIFSLRQKESCSSFNDSNINPSCDNVGNSNVSQTSPTHKTDKLVKNMAATTRPSLIKSKSSHDFQYIRSKFNSVCESSENQKTKYTKEIRTDMDDDVKENIPHNNGITKTEIDDSEESLLLKDVDLSLLYTEPIPKMLRNQNKTLPPKDCMESHLKSLNSIYSKSTLQLSDANKKEFLESLKQVLQEDLPGGLTDTLKVALSKPLPGGPAPQKPPRTFKYLAEAVLANNFIKNPSFLHVVKESPPEMKLDTPKGSKKGDAKYMLNKLESALKNNRLRAKKQPSNKADVSTSGEDSDDSLLFRSKSSRSLSKSSMKTLPDPPVAGVNQRPDTLFGELNCFNSLSCDNPTYDQIKEPSASFFVPIDPDPIYAEPVQLDNKPNESVSNRNSLYYMSTPLIHCNGENTTADGNNLTSKQICSDNSSLSSFASDLEAAPSPTSDDQHAKIRYLIKNFDTVQRRTLPSRLKRADESPTSSTDEHRGNNLSSSMKLPSANILHENGSVVRHKDPVLKHRNHESKVSDLIAKFQTYQRTMPKYQKPNVNKNKLFYCCLIIEKVKDCAQIKFKFPHDVTIPQNIEQLCFPESPNTPPLEGSSAAQTYTLLITSESGERTYGYCRRVLPEGSLYCLPLAYCILSKYRAPKFYKNILIELETRHGMQDKYRDNLINQFYNKKFPKPGESININLSYLESLGSSNLRSDLEDTLDLTGYVHVNKTGDYCCVKTKSSIFVSNSKEGEPNLAPSFVSYEGDKTELVLTLHTDTRYEVADLKKLHNLPENIILKIFSSLLLERKVILISESISELSSCVDSLQSILYPFTWYHTFIPIVPESLWDIVESPTPVICGVLSPKAVEHRKIENGIVVYLDTKSVLSEEKDELDILSGSMQRVWKQFITIANKAKSHEYVYSVYLADAYLSVFICCLKNYKQFVNNGQFLKEQFIAKAKTKGIRRFLNMFTETCMFSAFIDTALNNPESLETFDKKIKLYGSDGSRHILEKLIDWNR
ncbi:uncharacterized protein LOC143190441 isoform X3 [Rhynchophorus ferrugineus]|uniref:uncharacterized protein LOC143190441 isoform X3 n=1 Tax=Rhynchophorus ferrugineus TaxID=354439 RepID=UPI003FCE4E56